MFYSENRLKKYISIILAVVLFCFTNIPSSANSQRIELLNSAELQIALEKLNVLGTVLYFAAHPDDENTAALAYFSKGRKYRTAYLSLTRGDGGQNLIGPEKGAETGIIRTQELLSARGVDGAEQFFTRAIDFGYSKTAEESFAFWGIESILADVVWVIRSYRPDVIISRFAPGSTGGHGHHAASNPLIQEAFRAASDPKRFPEQLQYVQPWQVKRLCWNSWRPGRQDMDQLVRIDTGEYNPFLGKSYSEMAAESRSMHKSQGFGSSGRRGSRFDYFQHMEGIQAQADIFEGVDTSWNRVPGGDVIGRLLDEILNSFDPQEPSKSVPALLFVYKALTKLEETHWVSLKKSELLRIIQSCAGLWMEAIASDYSASPGDEVKVNATIVNRCTLPVRIEAIEFPGAASSTSSLDILLRDNEPFSRQSIFHIPKDLPISQPYWLVSESLKGKFSVQDQTLIGLAESPPSISMKLKISLDGTPLEYTVPLLFRWTDRVDGELYRPFEVRPPVTLELENKVSIFPDSHSKEISVKIKGHSQGVSGEVRLKGSDNWQIKPASHPFTLDNKYQEKQVVFTVTPPSKSDESVLFAEASVEGKKVSHDLVEISYPHIKRQFYFPPSKMKVVKLDIQTEGNKLGYIMGTGDEVADGLQNLGYEVVLLNDGMLEDLDLGQFDAIITGIRAYNTRERLVHTQGKLLEYVKNGGTLIVQYNVSRGLLTDNIGPYPLTFGRDRVSEEDAAVSLLNSGHQLLNFPNKITERDFDGWVQERGLYFASKWDEKYEPVLSSHDTNESDKKGGLLFARYGKGVYIFTGYSWFRQLPAGVPGAFRLFVNLISAGKYNGRSSNQ